MPPFMPEYRSLSGLFACSSVVGRPSARPNPERWHTGQQGEMQISATVHQLAPELLPYPIARARIPQRGSK